MLPGWLGEGHTLTALVVYVPYADMYYGHRV